MNNSFLKFIQHADLGKTVARRGLLSSHPVHFFVEISEEAAFAGTVTLKSAGTLDETSFCRRTHNHDLDCSEQSAQIVMGAPKVQKQCKALLYPHLSSKREEVPVTLSDSSTPGFYA